MQKAVLGTTEKSTQQLVREGLREAMSYTEYRNLVAQLAGEGKSTAPDQTDALTNYTQLNDRRMKRWTKRLKLMRKVRP